ncbi:hypothetical protein GQX74_001188 [Glossina fuscipes]|nr:hypothetical protein GQX74_001188 [Glossina fuscipes]
MTTTALLELSFDHSSLSITAAVSCNTENIIPVEAPNKHITLLEHKKHISLHMPKNILPRTSHQINEAVEMLSTAMVIKLAGDCKCYENGRDNKSGFNTQYDHKACLVLLYRATGHSLRRELQRNAKNANRKPWSYNRSLVLSSTDVCEDHLIKFSSKL